MRANYQYEEDSTVKKKGWIGLGIGLVAILAVGSLAVVWTAFASGPMGWGMGVVPISRGIQIAGKDATAVGTPGDRPWNWGPCAGNPTWYGPGMGPGMMGSWGTAGAGSSGITGCAGSTPAATPPGEARLDLEDAHEAVEQYLERSGLGHLRVGEVMEFSRNFYAIVEEPDTGVGAMELLVDRWSGLVGPEMGPNMMWNAKYGMMGRMMGYRSGEMRVSPEEAMEIAQQWLDLNLPGMQTEEHADAFYGYYTLHTLQNGRIAGMLSVHGTTGQVWYHTWHGEFLGMLDADEH